MKPERCNIWARTSVTYADFAAMLFCIVISTPSYSFELFGKTFFESKTEDTTIVDPLHYTISFSSEGMGRDEEDAIRSASELVAGKNDPVSGSLGLLVKAKADRDILVGALYEQARYAGLVQIFIDGRNLDEIPPTAEFDTQGPVPVEIRINGGKVFRFGAVRLVGDANDYSPEQFGLVQGEPARSSVILSAQNEILAELKNSGHPYAEVEGSDVEADHNTATLDVTLRVHAGPVANIGDISVTSNDAVDTDFIIAQAATASGQQYSPERINEIRKRLLALGVFGSVTIREGESLDQNGNVPLIIEVKERKHRYFGVGATYSNADGFGLEGYWGHRNLFGQAERLRLEGGISRIGDTQTLSGLNFNSAILFEKPGFYDPKSTFSASVRAVSENYDAFERRSVRAGMKVSREIGDQQTFSVGADLDLSRIVEDGEAKRHLIISTPLEYAFDSSDDPFNPTRGSKLMLQLEPGHDLESGASFVKGKAIASTYFQAADNLVLAARTAVGSIYGADLADIPADRRFFAGGGGSVRGFAFQSIGPRNASGRPTGGLSLFEASLEARLEVSETLSIVPFIDAGTVSTSQFPDFTDLRLGAGIGVRYQTPFGPLRVDVGVPLDRQPGEDQWGIYAGIGQAF